jgi:3-phenylpropionate/trans-cinnamate dioxygenase subunit beta
VRHLITNVQVLEAPDADTVKIASNFMVFKSRRNREENLFVGWREDAWRRESGAWKLEERIILLDHNVIEKHHGALLSSLSHCPMERLKTGEST